MSQYITRTDGDKIILMKKHTVNVQSIQTWGTNLGNLKCGVSGSVEIYYYLTYSAQFVSRNKNIILFAINFCGNTPVKCFM
jgi:hypothetical protein